MAKHDIERPSVKPLIHHHGIQICHWGNSNFSDKTLETFQLLERTTMSDHGLKIEAADLPDSQKIELRGVLAYLGLPTLVLLGFAAGAPSPIKVAGFGLFVVVYSYLYPWILLSKQPKKAEVLPPKSVDLVYYTLGIVGACLFFAANSISPPEFENRNSVASSYSDLAFFLWFKPEIVFDEQMELDALKSGLLQHFQEYVDKQDKRVDECAPRNFNKYKFCAQEKDWYRTAREHVDRGYVSVPIDRSGSTASSNSFVFSRAILVSRQPLGIPIYIQHKRFGTKRIVFNSTTLFDYQFLRETGAKVTVDKAFSTDFKPLIKQTEDHIEYLENEFLEIKEFQSISGFSYRLGNFWPFILCLALGMKIGRTRYSLAREVKKQTK